MENSKFKNYLGFTANELINIIGKELISLKGVINLRDFDFKKSKDVINESFNIIENI